MRGAPTMVGRTAAAGDPASARRLWQASEEMTGIAFPASLGRQVTAETAHR